MPISDEKEVILGAVIQLNLLIDEIFALPLNTSYFRGYYPSRMLLPQPYISDPVVSSNRFAGLIEDSSNNLRINP